MELSFTDWILWASGIVGHLALFSILLTKRRWETCAIFTLYIGFQGVLGLSLLLSDVLHYWKCYMRIYWSSIPIDFLLQLAIVLEIARTVMRPTGTWVRDARKQFLIWGGIGILFAALPPCLISPPASSFLAVLDVRGSLFTSLVISELITVVTLTSRRLGLSWRNHVMAMGQGWSVWALVAILVDALHAHFGMGLYFRDLEHVRMVIYLAAVGYWCIQFWRNEPARKPLPPEFQKYLQDLHIRVQSNLDTLEAQR